MDPLTGTVNESLLQLWDYFLISGWKAITKCGLYMLTSERDKMIEMTFEEVLGFITNAPSRVFMVEGHPPFTMYQLLKREYKTIPVTFQLERLHNEFEKIHNEVIQKNAKPKENPY